MSEPRIPLFVVRRVLVRDGGCCQRCMLFVVNPEAERFEGRGVDFSMQHRKPGGMGGTKPAVLNRPSNIVTLCGSGTTGCHGEVESHRTMALVDGWLVKQHEDPEVKPLRRQNGSWFQLDDAWNVTMV